MHNPETPLYVVGDIHGHLDALIDALDLIAVDGGQDAKVVFVGDLVDRGPDSRGVIEYLINGIANGRDWTVLKGNHDRMFEWFMESPPRHDPHLLVDMHWFHPKIGGIETMASYGVEVIPMTSRLYQVHALAQDAVPQAHVSFLRSLKLSHNVGNFVFVHAGLDPAVPLDRQAENDLLWLRPTSVIYPDDMGFTLVHGHTPESIPKYYGNRINVDGGAAFGNPIVPVALIGSDAFLLTANGRVKMEISAAD